MFSNAASSQYDQVTGGRSYIKLSDYDKLYLLELALDCEVFLSQFGQKAHKEKNLLMGFNLYLMNTSKDSRKQYTDTSSLMAVVERLLYEKKQKKIDSDDENNVQVRIERAIQKLIEQREARVLDKIKRKRRTTDKNSDMMRSGQKKRDRNDNEIADERNNNNNSNISQMSMVNDDEDDGDDDDGNDNDNNNSNNNSSNIGNNNNNGIGGNLNAGKDKGKKKDDDLYSFASASKDGNNDNHQSKSKMQKMESAIERLISTTAELNQRFDNFIAEQRKANERIEIILHQLVDRVSSLESSNNA